MHSRSNRAAVAAVLLTCLLLAGCTKIVKTLTDLSKLQAQIATHYREKDVRVNIHNGTSLNITFINSPLNDKGPEERLKRAQETAAFVKEHYAATNQLTNIWIGFVRQETRYLVIHYSQGLETFGFDHRGEPLSGTKEAMVALTTDHLQPTARYLPGPKQTEIIISIMQLQGSNEHDIALTPHFTVPGDATGIRRSSDYPQSVIFDFSSYSEKSLCPGAPKIVFQSEGKTIFETSDQFSTSKGPEGDFVETLALQIPYPAFRRMAGAKDLSLKMAEQEYRFSNEQLAALREMTEFVKE